MLRLQAESRGVSKGAKTEARRRGLVPGVLYGKGLEPAPIMVDGDALRGALKAGARHRLIELVGPGAEHSQSVLIKELQVDQTHQEVVHVDFFKPVAGRHIHIRVPVVIQGEDSLLQRGLILQHQLQEVECNCMPDSVPEAIYVDVSQFQPGQHISLGDIELPFGLQVIGQPQKVIVTVEAPMTSVIPGEGTVEVTSGV